MTVEQSDAEAAVARVEALCAKWELRRHLSVKQSQMIIELKQALKGEPRV